jgi:hypothetical protein
MGAEGGLEKLRSMLTEYGSLSVKIANLKRTLRDAGAE